MTEQELITRLAGLAEDTLLVPLPDALLPGAQFDRETKHFDLGFDSLDMVEFVMRVEETFNVEMFDDEIQDFETVGEVVDYLLPKLAV